jgi:hypothetical protein
LPGSFPASIDAAVTGKNSSRAIASEFPISITVGDNEVTGSGTSGSGTYRVILKSNFGRIIIERD